MVRSKGVIAHYVGLSSFLQDLNIYDDEVYIDLLSPTMSGCLHFYQVNANRGLSRDEAVIAHYIGLSSFLLH